jgi:hypothetical protein
MLPFLTPVADARVMFDPEAALATVVEMILSAPMRFL